MATYTFHFRVRSGFFTLDEVVSGVTYFSSGENLFKNSNEMYMLYPRIFLTAFNETDYGPLDGLTDSIKNNAIRQAEGIGDGYLHFARLNPTEEKSMTVYESVNQIPAGGTAVGCRTSFWQDTGWDTEGQGAGGTFHNQIANLLANRINSHAFSNAFLEWNVLKHRFGGDSYQYFIFFWPGNDPDADFTIEKVI